MLTWGNSAKLSAPEFNARVRREYDYAVRLLRDVIDETCAVIAWIGNEVGLGDVLFFAGVIVGAMLVGAL